MQSTRAGGRALRAGPLDRATCATGPSSRPNAIPESISVLDITPVMLTILRVPLARDLDGGVPDGLLPRELLEAREWVEAYPIPAVAVSTEGLGHTLEEEAVHDQLRKLG